MKNTKIILIFLSLFFIYGLFLFINKNNLEYKQFNFMSSENINKCNQKEKDLKVQKTLKPNNSKVLDYVFENFETESPNNILGVSDDTSLSLSKNNKSLNLNYSDYNNIKDFVKLHNYSLRQKHKQQLKKDLNFFKDTKNSLSKDQELLNEKKDEIQKYDKEHKLKEVIKNINISKEIGDFKSFF